MPIFPRTVAAETDPVFTDEYDLALEIDNGASGAAETIDWTSGSKQKSTLSEACTFTFTPPDGVRTLTLKCINFGAFTPTWPGTVIWSGGDEPEWKTSGTDIAEFVYDGTSYYGTVISVSISTDGTLAGDSDAAVPTEKAVKTYVDSLSGTPTYLFTKAVAGTSWVVSHNLGSQYVSVTCYDSSDEIIIPDSIVATDVNTTTITFSTSRTGKAVVIPNSGTTTNNSSYLHTQSGASASWSVDHSLNDSYPVVQVYDSSDDVIIPSTIEIVDADNLTITFSSAITGKAKIIS